MTNDSSTTSLIIQLIDSHPGIFTLLVILLTSIVALLIVGIFFGLKSVWKAVKKSKIKTGPVEIDFSVSDKAPSSTNARTLDFDEAFITCISQVINVSVENGFDRSLKRHELFNRQISYANLRYENIISDLKTEYINKTGSHTNIKLIDMLLHFLFNDCAIKSLEKVFKADRLIEKQKDAIVSVNRQVIESVSQQILFRAHELATSRLQSEGLSLSLIDETLIEIISDRTNEITRATTDIIEQAWELATEEMESMKGIQEDLNEKIKDVLFIYLGKEASNTPNNWNDSLPPNEIVGGA